MEHLGTQWTAELYGCDPALLDDTERVSAIMLAAAEVARATIVGSQFHRFSPHGVSGVVVIAESHLAIHTWPEHGYAALDVFTCGDTLLTEAAFQFLAGALRATRVDAVRQQRGAPDRISAFREPPAPPLHPALLRRDDTFADQFLRPGPARELGEQLLTFPLFAPAWCGRIVEECENVPRWRQAPGGSELSLDQVPGLAETLAEVVATRVAPRLAAYWPTWRFSAVEAPRVVRQRPGDTPPPTCGSGALTLHVPLNADATGGDPAFPRWGLTLTDLHPGHVLAFPGGLSHVHAARPVTAGRRYTLTCALR